MVPAAPWALCFLRLKEGLGAELSSWVSACKASTGRVASPAVPLALLPASCPARIPVPGLSRGFAGPLFSELETKIKW